MNRNRYVAAIFILALSSCASSPIAQRSASESQVSDQSMKHLPNIVCGLLGLLFIAFGLMVLLKLGPTPPPPEGSSSAQFMAAFATTGYLTFEKVLEVLGGILVAIPRTRNTPSPLE